MTIKYKNIITIEKTITLLKKSTESRNLKKKFLTGKTEIQ